MSSRSVIAHLFIAAREFFGDPCPCAIEQLLAGGLADPEDARDVGNRQIEPIPEPQSRALFRRNAAELRPRVRESGRIVVPAGTLAPEQGKREPIARPRRGL